MLMVMVMTITACAFLMNTPEEYFNQAALNNNKITRFGTYYFKPIKYLKNTISPGKLTEFKESLKNSILKAKKNLENVKKLHRSTETKPMIDAPIIPQEYVSKALRNTTSQNSHNDRSA
jgi:hypothetical protein